VVDEVPCLVFVSELKNRHQDKKF